MPVSIIDVDVNDDRFKAFKAMFDEYRERLDKLGGSWDKQEASADRMADHFRDMTASMMAWASILHQIGEEERRQEREAEKAEKDAARRQREEEKVRRDRIKASKQMVDDAKSVARSVATTSYHLAKWALMGGAFGLVASGFGVGAAISGIGNAGRNAARLGATPGELAAADVNLSRYGDVRGWMQTQAEARFDVGSLAAYRTMGIDPTGKRTAELMVETMARAKAMFDRFMSQSQGNAAAAGAMAQAYGLTKFFSISDLLAFHNTTPKDFQAQLDAARGGAGALDISPKDVAGAQAFQAEMKRLVYRLEATFAPVLTKLEPELISITRRFGDMAEVFARNPQINANIDRFLKWLGTLNFDPKKFDEMVTGFGLVADEIIEVGKKLKWLLPSKPAPGSAEEKIRKAQDATAAWATDPANWSLNPLDWNTPLSNLRLNNPWNLRPAGASHRFRSFSSVSDAAKEVWAQIKRYQYGPKFGHADTIAKLINVYEGGLSGNKDKNDIAAYVKAVAKELGMDPNAKVDTNDVGFASRLLAAIAHHEGMSSGKGMTAGQITVMLKASPGTNVSTAAVQLPR